MTRTNGRDRYPRWHVERLSGTWNSRVGRRNGTKSLKMRTRRRIETRRVFIYSFIYLFINRRRGRVETSQKCSRFSCRRHVEREVPGSNPAASKRGFYGSLSSRANVIADQSPVPKTQPDRAQSLAAGPWER